MRWEGVEQISEVLLHGLTSHLERGALVQGCRKRFHVRLHLFKLRASSGLLFSPSLDPMQSEAAVNDPETDAFLCLLSAAAAFQLRRYSRNPLYQVNTRQALLLPTSADGIWHLSAKSPLPSTLTDPAGETNVSQRNQHLPAPASVPSRCLRSFILCLCEPFLFLLLALFSLSCII